MCRAVEGIIRVVAVVDMFATVGGFTGLVSLTEAQRYPKMARRSKAAPEPVHPRPRAVTEEGG